MVTGREVARAQPVAASLAHRLHVPVSVLRGGAEVRHPDGTSVRKCRWQLAPGLGLLGFGHRRVTHGGQGRSP